MSSEDTATLRKQPNSRPRRPSLLARIAPLILAILAPSLLVAATEFGFKIANDRRAKMFWYEGDADPMLYRNDPDLGLVARPNIRVTRVLKTPDETIFDVEYNIDANSRRVTPTAKKNEDAQKFLVFFGGSFTFGAGVEDDEAFPERVAQLADDEYRTYNYGFNGYGPHHMLALLQSGIAIFTFFPHHIRPVIGSMRMSEWASSFPRYTLDADKSLVRRGSFRKSRKLLGFVYELLSHEQILRFFNVDVPIRVKENDIELTARVIEESRNLLEEQFQDVKFYVLLHPYHPSNEVDPAVIVPYLKEAGIRYFDYRELIDLSADDLIFAYDLHPKPEAYMRLATRLVEDLGIGK